MSTTMVRHLFGLPFALAYFEAVVDNPGEVVQTEAIQAAIIATLCFSAVLSWAGWAAILAGGLP